MVEKRVSAPSALAICRKTGKIETEPFDGGEREHEHDLSEMWEYQAGW